MSCQPSRATFYDKIGQPRKPNARLFTNPLQKRHDMLAVQYTFYHPHPHTYYTSFLHSVIPLSTSRDASLIQLLLEAYDILQALRILDHLLDLPALLVRQLDAVVLR